LKSSSLIQPAFQGLLGSTPLFFIPVFYAIRIIIHGNQESALQDAAIQFQKLKTNKMSNKKFNHYVPYRFNEQPPWAENMKVKILIHAATVGLTPVEMTEVGDTCQGIIDANNKVAAKRLELDEAMNNRDDVQKTLLKRLRQIINRIRNHKNYTTAIGGELGIIGSSYERDLDNIRPTLKPVAQAGYVKVRFNLQGMPGVAIYSRVKDNANWNFLAYQHKSPYLDRRPLTQAGKAEISEYMAVYFDGNETIGQQSSIETIVFAGPLDASL
jgi:hypothetical protein